MGRNGGKVFRFEEFSLDLRRGMLRCGDGERGLRAKGFALLLYLIENAGRLVSKDELIGALWPDVVVGDESLARCISDVRHALADHDQRIIKTVLRRGYVFIAAVSIDEAEPDEIWPEHETAPAVPRSGDQVPKPARKSTNLAEPMGEMLGREQELAELPRYLELSRLVTLTGPSGIGKTRLARELGWRMRAVVRDGVWRVDLATCRDPSSVAVAVALELGSAEASVDAIAAAIAERHLLLIIDNCEHLAAYAAALTIGLLQQVPGLRVLATSQEPLHIPPERAYLLEPLPVPPPAATVSEIEASAAVRLFVARAQAADRHFRLKADNAMGVGEICRRLDGNPLALEMAAARVRLFGVDGLSRRLDERLNLLQIADRGAPIRHHSLRDMIDWSYGLLEAADQRVFCRLGIFAGSFSLDAGVAVATDEPAASGETIDAISRLIDRSLVMVDGGEQPRYRLLETPRLYATEQLELCGETDRIAERHAGYFKELFDGGEGEWHKMPNAAWFTLYRPEIDNLRAAVQWSLAEPERTPIAHALTMVAMRLWFNSEMKAFGQHYFDQTACHIRAALTRLLTKPASIERDRQEFAYQSMLTWALFLIKGPGSAESMQVCRRARDLAVAVGSVFDRLASSYWVWFSDILRADLAEAAAVAQECLGLCLNLGIPLLICAAERMVGTVHSFAGNFVEAREHCLRSAAVYDEVVHSKLGSELVFDSLVVVLAHKAMALWALGHPDQAREAIDAALAHAKRLGHAASLSYAYRFAAIVDGLMLRDDDRAAAHAKALAALGKQYALSDAVYLARAVEGWLRLEAGDPGAAAEHIRPAIDALRQPATSNCRSIALALFAEAQDAAGEVQAALGSIAEAIAFVDASGEACWSAELHRLRGVSLIRAASDRAGAETALRQALAIAGRQQALSFALRAALDLARLLADDGKVAEAHDLLNDLYQSFAEGFDTPDLRMARALLEELAPCRNTPRWAPTLVTRAADGTGARNAKIRISPAVKPR